MKSELKRLRTRVEHFRRPEDLPDVFDARTNGERGDAGVIRLQREHGHIFRDAEGLRWHVVGALSSGVVMLPELEEERTETNG